MISKTTAISQFQVEFWIKLTKSMQELQPQVMTTCFNAHASICSLLNDFEVSTFFCSLHAFQQIKYSLLLWSHTFEGSSRVSNIWKLQKLNKVDSLCESNTPHA